MLAASHRRLLPLVLMACACGSAQSKDSAAPEDDLDDGIADSVKKPGPLLWKVKSEGGPTSYVLGTIHVGVVASELSPQVWQALEGSRIFVMEADVESARDTSTGPSLRQSLDAGQLARLEALVGPRAAEALANLGPYSAYGALLQSLYPGGPSMDLALARAAGTRGHRIEFLESWQEQLALARRYFTAEDFAELLDPKGEVHRELDSLIEAYRGGNVAALRAIALDQDRIAEDPEHYEDLFFRRNLAWAERASPWLQSESCFIAVGVGHLPGDRGLLRLLGERGFTVERVATPDGTP